MLQVEERLVLPGAFDVVEAWYPGVAATRLHPTVAAFLELAPAQIAARHARLRPGVDRELLLHLLRGTPRWLRWAGADLLPTVDADGVRRMVLLETNSCPSGCKSTPKASPVDRGAYERLAADVFLPLLQDRGLPEGGLAVLWDKNEREARAGAALLADLTGEPVQLVHVPPEGGVVREHRRVLHVRRDGGWMPLRAALRYVTRRPWAHLPAAPRTALLNPVVACLAGGRNKGLAAKAYADLDADLAHAGLRILTPATWVDLTADEVPEVVGRLGGRAVIKEPYANAGRGVTTVTSPEELDAWRARPAPYDRWVVQALVGDPAWSSPGARHHAGTVPTAAGEAWAADLRLMVGVTPQGFAPIALYGRRARAPLPSTAPAPGTSWDVLGTNLTLPDDGGPARADTERLIVLDEVGFDALGLGLDDLVDAYVQTVLATTAIDRVASTLVGPDGRLRTRRLARLVPDPALLAEVVRER